MHKTTKKSVVSWCFFDWAVSSFSSLVMTFIFATYFTQSVAKTPLLGTAQWGDAVALAGVLVAICGPIFGAIADAHGPRKPWLAICVAMTVIATALLWWVKPAHQYATYMLTLVVFGIIGLEVGTIFYNAMLRHIAPEKYIGRISGWAWGLGYVGGLICLTISLVLFIHPQVTWFHLDHATAAQVRICGPFVAAWILIFSLPLFIWTRDQSVGQKVGRKQLVRSGLATLWRTLRTLPSTHKTIFLFLIAHMLYMDGLNTLFAFGGIYAAGTFGLTMSQVLVFGIAMNVTAGIGAAGFAWLDDLWGAKPTVLLSLVLLVTIGCGVLLVHSTLWFWVLALTLGLFVGPVQAASRSLMARLSPPELINEFFGLYAFSGKATAFINPWLVGMLTLYFNSQRIGMASVMFFMLAGALLLLCVRVSKV